MSTDYSNNTTPFNNGGSAPLAGTFRDASYRGVPFVMLEGDSRFGRRNVVHEYPYRDKVWVEDLGRSARRINVQGFLVTNSDGDCVTKRDRMIAACEAAGGEKSILIHPTYGQLIVNLIGSLTVRERWDKGRMFEIGFSFIESGQREFPSSAGSTADVVAAAADAADAAAGVDFGLNVAAPLKNGASVVQQAVSAAATFAGTATRLANDATNLRNLVTTLPGNFGRYAGGRNVGGLAGAAYRPAGGAATVASLTALGSKKRSAVASATLALGAAASGLGQ